MTRKSQARKFYQVIKISLIKKKILPLYPVHKADVME